jgi:hypothetical protein
MAEKPTLDYERPPRMPRSPARIGTLVLAGLFAAFAAQILRGSNPLASVYSSPGYTVEDIVDAAPIAAISVFLFWRALHRSK